MQLKKTNPCALNNKHLTISLVGDGIWGALMEYRAVTKRPRKEHASLGRVWKTT